VAAGVPFFFKQWGEWGLVEQTTVPDERPGYAPVPVIVDHCGRLHYAMEAWASPIDGRFKPTSFIPRPGSKGNEVMERCGKKRAGRLLDGREWNGFPEVSRG
jgi:hypothetical protein